MKKRLQVVVWLPVLWVLYQFDLLQALVWVIVLAGFWEIGTRAPWTKMTIVAIFHMAGFLFILLLPQKEVWVLIWIVVANDTFAYIGGSLVKSKVLRIHPFPNISPKKTVAGYIYGIIAGITAGVVMANHPNLLLALVVVFSICVCAICGDLLESKFKRFYGIKDSGEGLITSKLMCGHGGVYDRFDAIALVCPIWFYFDLLLG